VERRLPATKKSTSRTAESAQRTPAKTQRTSTRRTTQKTNRRRTSTPQPKTRSRAKPTRQQTITLPGGFKVRVNRGNLTLDALKRGLRLPGGLKLPW
jgi:hypothetical protein